MQKECNAQGYDLCILGGGESGVGCALLASRRGLRVALSDQGRLQPARREELQRLGVFIEEGGHTEGVLLSSREVVKSPGIPNNAPILQRARGAGIPVVGEIEFAYRYKGQARVVGITGSNGKTTTTSLIHHILKVGGVKARLCGNIGYSFARAVADPGEADVYVVELSSFQLEDIESFRADVALLLNITPDHLDRYNHDISLYQRAKMMVAKNLTPADSFIYNLDDVGVKAGLSLCPVGHGQRVGFTQREGGASVGASAWVEGEELRFKKGGQGDGMLCIPRAVLPIKGLHNEANTLAAVLACLRYGLGEVAILEGLKTFRSLPHRMEPVRELEGVHYINDSKATNVDAVWYALDAMREGVIWIAGGTDKGNDYSALYDLVRRKVRVLVCLGVDNGALIEHFRDKVERIVETRSAKEAVRAAHELAQPGETVLLSPACASFDLFKNYEDRGDQFKECVKEL